MNILDEKGLSTLWGKIKSTFASKNQLTDGSVTKIGTTTVGSTDRPVYINNGVPSVSSVGEAFLTWGGKNYNNGYGPIDAAMNPVLSPNRIAGMNPTGILVEYSTDAGVTWSTYELTDTQKKSLVTTNQSIRIAGPTASCTKDCQLRVTLDGVDGSVYTALNKIHIYVTTNYSGGCTVSIESYDYNSSTTWHNVVTNQGISGWSGWNVINFTLPGSSSFGGTNNNTHQRKIRLIFKNTSVTPGYESKGLLINKIYAYGGVGWTTASNLGAYGTPYTYDCDQNTTFPAKVIASTFKNSSGVEVSYVGHTHSQYLTGITSSQVTTALGYTPYNSTNPNGYTTNTGTVTSVAVKMNGSVVNTITSSGTIDLGTVITSHQDISGKQDKITSSNKLSYSLISGTPTIPTITDTYSSTSSSGMSGKAVSEAINSLDVSDTAVDGKYISAVSEVDGKISVTRADLTTGAVKPIASKTYDAYVCTANDINNANLYFISVTLNDTTNFTTPWQVHYKLYVNTTTNTNVVGCYDVTVGASGSTFVYSAFNSLYSTDYRPIYNHSAIYPKSGYSSRGVKLGARIYSAKDVTTLQRIYKIEILGTTNCTAVINETIGLYKDIYNSTYYYHTEFSPANGLQETGDADTYTILQMSSSYCRNGSSLRLPYLALFGYGSDNTTQAISNYQNGFTSYTTSINQNRVYNTNGIDYKKGLFVHIATSSFATDAEFNVSIRPYYSGLDFRYSDNCVNSSTANALGIVKGKSIYLKGVIKSDGLFYVRPISVTYNNKTYKRAWTQDIPTAKEFDEDGNQFFYWYVGEPYYASSYAESLYQVNLYDTHPIFWFNNGKFEQYDNAILVNGHTVETDVPSNAVFTDTTYSSKSAASGGTDVSLVTTGEKYTWNSKQNAITSSSKLSYSLVSGTPTKLSDFTDDLGTTPTHTHSQYLTGITSSQVTTALGFTPYNSTNPNGYTTNTGTVTSVTLSAGTGIALDSTSAITTSGTRTISMSSTYQTYCTNGNTAYGWGNHANAGYVTLSGAQTITGAKTFSSDLNVTGNVISSKGVSASGIHDMNMTVSGAASWGDISGTITDQTDLMGLLNAKGTYSKPSGGIPMSDLSATVQNQINSSYKSEAWTAAGSTTQLASLYYRKVGDMVWFKGKATSVAFTASQSGYTTLFTLPEGYRPTAEYIVRIVGSSFSTSNAAYIEISVTTAGIVRLLPIRYNGGVISAAQTVNVYFNNISFFID